MTRSPGLPGTDKTVAELFNVAVEALTTIVGNASVSATIRVPAAQELRHWAELKRDYELGSGREDDATFHARVANVLRKEKII